MKKRFLSILMAAAMVLSLLPASALAVGAEANVAEVNGTGYPTLQAAFDNAQDGDTIKLLADVTLDPLYAMDEEEVEDAPIRSVITVTSDITLDLDSHEISWDSKKIPGENEPEIWYTLCFFVVSGADVKITGNGNGTIDVEAGNNNSYGINITNNGSVTVENGTYTGATTAIQVQEGSLTILGGTFEQAETIAGQAPGYAKYVINCIDANFKNGTARIYVKGGTFCFDPDGKPENSDVTYVPVDYESNANEEDGTWTVTAKGSIGVDKPSSGNISDGTVDATVGGVTVPSDSSNQVVVDAAVENASDVTTANVTVGGDALTAVKEAANVSSLAIKTNVGTLTISDAALDTIITKATDGSSVADVTLSIAVDSEKTTANSVTYDFTATDARGVEVFDQTASEDATITVTVDAPSGASENDTVYIYYIDGDTRTLEDTQTVAKDKTVTWNVTHFSSREITKTMDEVTYTNSEGNEVTGTLAEAVENAKDETTITLLRNVQLTAGETVGSRSGAINISGNKTLTIDGQNYTITASNGFDQDTGTSWAAVGNHHVINIENGAAVTLQNLIIDGEWNATADTSGSENFNAARSGINVWQNENATVMLNNVTVKNCSTYAVTVNDSTVEATNLKTEGNNWGVNIDADGTLTIGGENTSIGETSSIVYENVTPVTGTLTVNGGTYQNIVIKAENQGESNSGTVILNDGSFNGITTEGNGTTNVGGDDNIVTVRGGSYTVVNESSSDGVNYAAVGSLLDEGCKLVTGEDGSSAVAPSDDSVASIGSKGYTTLAAAIAGAENGDTIVLEQDITGMEQITSGTISSTLLTIPDNMELTIVGNGKKIEITLPQDEDSFRGRDQAISVGSTKNSTAVLTLDNVDLTIAGLTNPKAISSTNTDTAYGDAIDMWGTLNITNGSAIVISGVTSAFTMQGGENAKVNIDNSSVTTNSINGNFSNGGIWEIANGSVVSINDCDTHGLSVETVKIDGSTVTVDGAKYTGLYGTTIEIVNGASVTVQNCGTSLDGTSYDDKGAVQLKEVAGETSTLTVTGSTLSLDNNANGAESGEQSIYIGNGTADISSDATVTGELVYAAATGDTYRIIYTVNGETYYTVSAEATGAEGAKTITYTAPADPTDLGSYRFDGWDYGNVTVSGPDASGNVTITVDSPDPTNNTYTFAADLTYTGGSSGGSTRYAVTAPSNVSNGAVTVSPSRASYNQTVTITVTPDEGYELSSLTVTDRNGSTISLTKVSDTRYTFTMPRSAVTISASFAEEQLVSSLPFTDVSVDDWFYDMVEYVYDNGIMTGTSGTTFEPNATLTRAMMATVLWAMEGNPTAGSGSYTDVSSGDWYYNAVRWATGAGVVNGVGDNTFAPNDPLTREQMAVMLYAYAVYKGYDTAASTAAESFNDSGEISGWALTAMNWAVDNGLLGGKPGNLLDPTGSATRAEIATILRNFCENIVK